MLTQRTVQLNQRTVVVAGVKTTALENKSSKTPLVFLNGGVSGVAPYCSGSHIWGSSLGLFAAERSVIAIDLPGTGGTGVPKDGLRVDTMTRHVRESLDAFGIERCHIVGHDLAGLIALMLAAELPGRVRGVTAVSALAAAPTGDSLENLTLKHPPAPLWSRASQKWALEQLSYSHHPIDGVLLDACVAAAKGEAHAAAQAAMGSGRHADVFVPSLLGAKGRFYEIARTVGISVPVQVIWGTHDPLGTLDQGLWLYKIVAAKQTASQFHVINRAGALPFLEEPGVFHSMVSAFAEVVFPV